MLCASILENRAKQKDNPRVLECALRSFVDSILSSILFSSLMPWISVLNRMSLLSCTHLSALDSTSFRELRAVNV